MFRRANYSRNNLRYFLIDQSIVCYIILIITKFLRINKSIIYITVAYNLCVTTCTVPGGETVLCPDINNLMGRL